MQSNLLAAAYQPRRYWLVGSCCVVALVLAWLSVRAESHLETTAHVEGSEAERVEQQLAQQFQSSFTHRAILVVPPGSAIATIQRRRGCTARDCHGAATGPGRRGDFFLPRDWNGCCFPGSGGRNVLLLSDCRGAVPKSDTSLFPGCGNSSQALSDRMRSRFSGLQRELTGETPLNLDLSKVS